MDSQLPLFNLRLVGLAIPIIPDTPPYHVFEVITWDGTVIGYALLAVEELNAES